jgi:hypothetical protein
VYITWSINDSANCRFTGIYATLITAGKEYEVIELLITGFQMVFGTILPFVVIFTCNILIIITLRKASKERKKLDASQERRPDSQHLTRMLIFVSFAYVMLTLPYRLNHFAMKIPAVANMYNFEVVYWRKKYVIQTWTLIIIWLGNYSVNFYLYCLGGGKKYREDARRVIGEIVQCCT